MANIDPTPIKGAAGLVKSHTVSQDSEKTDMRTGKDILETAQAISAIENSCDGVKQSKVLKGIFRTRAKSKGFRDG